MFADVEWEDTDEIEWRQELLDTGFWRCWVLRRVSQAITVIVR